MSLLTHPHLFCAYANLPNQNCLIQNYFFSIYTHKEIKYSEIPFK
jgi:hypothetical protein